MIPEKIQWMIDNEGVYVGGDSNHPTITVIVVSFGGKLWSVKFDEVLAPGRFLPTFTVHGPYQAAPPAPPPADEQYFAGRKSMLDEIIDKLRDYDAYRSAQIAASVAVNPQDGIPAPQPPKIH